MNSTDNILNRIDELLEKNPKGVSLEEAAEVALAVTNIDVGKQIELHRDFEFNPSGWEFRDFYGEVLDMISFRLGEQSSGEQGKVDYLISVNHGPVIYLAEDEIEESIINVQKGSSGAIIPFLKRKKYEEQQEYRFVIRVRCHSPNENPFYLKVSEELRNLMKPIENVLW